MIHNNKCCKKCGEQIIALLVSVSCGCTHSKTTTSDVSKVWTGGVDYGYIVTTYKDAEEYVLANYLDAVNWAKINGYYETHHIVKVSNVKHFDWQNMAGVGLMAHQMYFAYHNITGYDNSSHKNKVLGIEIMKP